MIWITLRPPGSRGTLRVNAEAIATMARDGDGATYALMTSGDYLTFVEAPEEVESLITAAQPTLVAGEMLAAEFTPWLKDAAPLPVGNGGSAFPAAIPPNARPKARAK